MQDKNNKTGYLLIFDIRDSTKRKDVFEEQWERHLVEFYEAAERMASTLHGKAKRKPIVKKIGDAVMVFIETAISLETSKGILADAKNFCVSIEARDDLDEMRLKCVVGAITQAVGIDGDVLGKEIDLCFRLEKYADVSHVVINEAMHQSLGAPARQNQVAFIKTTREIKGWRQPQQFILVAEMGDLADNIQKQVKSDQADHVLLELFDAYLEFQRGACGE